MSDCCTPHPNKRRCPGNGLECAEVSARTILHHIKSPWLWHDTGQRYFYCGDPDCDIVYFGEDGAVIRTAELRNPAKGELLCYCFGVTHADALNGVRDFVLEKTGLKLCSCETSNPSGRCCLKDFPR